MCRKVTSCISASTSDPAVTDRPRTPRLERGVRVSGIGFCAGQKMTMLRNACSAAFARTCPHQTPTAFHAWCGKPWGPIPFHGKGLRPPISAVGPWTKFHHAGKRLRHNARTHLSTSSSHRFPRTVWKTTGGMDKKSPRLETPAVQCSRPLVHIQPPSISTRGVENNKGSDDTSPDPSLGSPVAALTSGRRRPAGHWCRGNPWRRSGG